MSVQRKMWALVRGTDKVNYVSNPANGGGLHNYGMAVDVTILDKTGAPLPMGTPFDFFGEEAHTNNEEALLDAGKIDRTAYDNRRLLRRIMRNAGSFLMNGGISMLAAGQKPGKAILFWIS